MDWSPPCSSVHGILQAKIVECVAIPFSRGSSRPKDRTQVSSLAGEFFTTEPPGGARKCMRVAANLSNNECVIRDNVPSTLSARQRVQAHTHNLTDGHQKSKAQTIACPRYITTFQSGTVSHLHKLTGLGAGSAEIEAAKSDPGFLATLGTLSHRSRVSCRPELCSCSRFSVYIYTVARPPGKEVAVSASPFSLKHNFFFW